MNHVSLSGRLTHEPKLIHREDRAICEIRVAVDNYKHDPTFIDVRTFDSQAYACAEFLSKGRKVGVSGRLIYKEWRGRDDSKRERYSIIGDVEFLDPPSVQPELQSAEVEPEDTGSEAKVAELLAA
jgi:single-strand DNA-binding protein